MRIEEVSPMNCSYSRVELLGATEWHGVGPGGRQRPGRPSLPVDRTSTWCSTPPRSWRCRTTPNWPASSVAATSSRPTGRRWCGSRSWPVARVPNALRVRTSRSASWAPQPPTAPRCISSTQPHVMERVVVFTQRWPDPPRRPIARRLLERRCRGGRRDPRRRARLPVPGNPESTQGVLARDAPRTALACRS